MRIRKGDTVEVMNEKLEPFLWRPAKILSGNGHTYRVQYCYNCLGEQIETLSKKFVRPCPPPVQGVEHCNVGDVVEVFYEYAWQVATILKVLEGKKEMKTRMVPPWDDSARKQCLVRLLGCTLEVIIDGSNIRMRQSWHDGEWILIRKSSQQGDVIVSRQLAANVHQKIAQHNLRARKQPQNEAAFRDSQIISSRSLKRTSPYGSSIIETRNRHVQKLRAVEKDGRQQRVAAAPVLNKVHAVDYQRGNKNRHTSFKIISTKYNQTERAVAHEVLGNSRDQNNKNISGKDACSVGSCSVTNQSQTNFYIPFRYQFQQQRDALSSDAESCIIGLGHERKCRAQEVEVNIRFLEVHAYRRTLEALYASGPLSWDQEELLTNLRILLHISNDEHLMELKHLASARISTKVR